MYKYTDPHDINQHIIQYVNNSFRNIKTNTDICYCIDDLHYNCTIHELGPVYPGQTYKLKLIVNSTVDAESVVTMSIDAGHKRACKSHIIKNHFQLFHNACTTIDYTIQYNKNAKSCELYLQGEETFTMLPIKGYDLQRTFLNVYRVKLSPCPLGFTMSVVVFC